MISGYAIEGLVQQDSRWRVYQGTRHADKLPVYIKIPSSQTTLPDPAFTLKSEFKLLQNVPADGLLNVFEIISRAADNALILENSGGQFLDQVLKSERMALLDSLKIAVQLTSTLVELHRRGVAHGCLHSGIILLGPEKQRPWISGLDQAFYFDERYKTKQQNKQASDFFCDDSLAYMSPEQTGRIEANIDYRTDFYSLGILFYEMLTGKPPFQSQDALELVHAHLAQTPKPVSHVNTAVPEALSQIVMQLLNKRADNRCESGFQLLADLRHCADEYSTHGSITELTSSKTPSGQFEIPQKLYGRANEISLLLDAYEGVRKARIGLVFVSGYSGVGKTSLIQHIQKPVVKEKHKGEYKGYFISGKFDQLERSNPYSAIIAAFRQLLRQILSQPDTDIQHWKQRILEALKPNAHVIIEVLPELETIIGKQAAVPKLKALEAQNRFLFYFQKFIAALAQPEHPLVLFLDDLQWASMASIKLIQAWVTGLELQGLLIIGAYRDNEVDENHPLSLSIKEIRNTGAQLDEIRLMPLTLDDITQLIRDTFACSERACLRLAELVHKKTQGNPFFARSFLKNLYTEQQLYFVPRLGWQFDIEAINTVPATENVVDLMTRNIERLDVSVQKTLKLAAYIGNPFDLKTLSITSDNTTDVIRKQLKEAIDEGLIVQHGELYRFYHDRIQEAAYGLVPEDQRALLHQQIGSMQLSRCTEEALEGSLFKIVNHLNAGSELLLDQVEKIQLAAFNLRAGLKAKLSTAYTSALAYFQQGVALLDETQWTAHYTLAFALHSEQAECAYLCGQFEQAEADFNLLMEHARSRQEKTTVYIMRIVQYENLSRFPEASAFGLECLRLFDIHFPTDEKTILTSLDNEINTIQQSIGEKRIAELISLPRMQDADMRVCMKLLMTMWAPTYISGNLPLTMLIAATLVRLSLAHGNSEESAYGYVTHAINLVARTGDYKNAYAFGLLALSINDEFDDRTARAKVNHMFSCYICFWRKHINACFTYSRAAYESGLESGDFTYGGYAAFHESWHALFGGMNLDRFNEEYSTKLQFLTGNQYQSISDAHQLILQWGLCLQGRTDERLSLDALNLDPGFSEQAYLDSYRDVPFFVSFYYVAKLNICYLFRDYSQAMQMAEKAGSVIHGVRGMIWDSILCFNHALTLAAVYDSIGEDSKAVAWQKLESLQQQLHIWAKSGPENYQHQYSLICAEMARLQNQVGDAITHYEKAIQSAKQNGFIQNEALANELFARYWLEGGHSRLASIYFQDAQRAYQRWGSIEKAQQINSLRLESLQQAGISTSTFDSPLSLQSLDVTSLLKASQAISGEIIRPQLVKRLMKLVLENAGAQRGLLLCAEGQGWIAEAESRVLDGSIITNQVQNTPLDTQWSSQLINYVSHTHENLVTANAQQDDRLLNDDYVQLNEVKSVLCTPILQQQQLTAILYLENNLNTHVFTPERVLLIQALASQAAIALENSHLYSEVIAEVMERKQAEKALYSSEENYRLLVENQTDLMVKLDTTGCFLFVSPSFCEAFATPAQQLLGTPFQKLVLTDDLERVEHAWQKLFVAPHTARVEIRALSSQGERWFSWSLKGILSRHHESYENTSQPSITEIVSVGRDVTEQRLAEEQARENLHALAHVARLKSMGEMASTLAHELNQPLTSILSFSQASQRVLKNQCKHMNLPDDLPFALERISDNAQRAGDIISHMRSFIRKEKVCSEDTDINQLIHETMDLVDAELRHNRVDIRLELEPGLPLISADRVQLQQVIMNLVRNSMEAIRDHDSPLRRITVSSQLTKNDFIDVLVTDSGPGLDEKIADHVFSAFVTTKTEGIGIGLSICKSIVRSHGGQLRAESLPQGGALFRFNLPLDGNEG